MKFKNLAKDSWAREVPAAFMLGKARLAGDMRELFGCGHMGCIIVKVY